MKKAQLAEVVVGLVFVAAVSLLGIYTIVITGVALGTPKLYKVVFAEVFGLREGDAVRIEGFEVGQVRELRPLEDSQILAVIEVRGEVDIYRVGSEVSVVPFSPLGGRVVEIKRGKAAPGVEPYSFFGSRDDAVSREEADIIQGHAVGELLQTLNRLVDENRESVRQIVGNLERVSAQLNRSDNILGYLINSQVGQQRLEGVVNGMSSSADRLDRILTRVEEGQGVIGGLVTPGSRLGEDVEGAMHSARSAFDSASAILARADEGRSAVGVLVSDRPDVTEATRGIVTDVKEITGRVAEGRGTIGKLVHDDRLYEGAASTAENLSTITERMQNGQGVLGVLSDDRAGEDVRAILRHGASIAGAIDDPEAGALGLIIHDDVLRGRISRIVEEMERLVVEFRDSLEDAREQAPVNAFIGAVFAAF
ncbi:MAG: MCE family protein [Planctomycetes bacterium]|nr:MCE family protein [Planctomycetota bacterium]